MLKKNINGFLVSRNLKKKSSRVTRKSPQELLNFFLQLGSIIIFILFLSRSLLAEAVNQSSMVSKKMEVEQDFNVTYESVKHSVKEIKKKIQLMNQSLLIYC